MSGACKSFVHLKLSRLLYKSSKTGTFLGQRTVSIKSTGYVDCKMDKAAKNNHNETPTKPRKVGKKSA